jgi:hypothetical protein
VVQFRPNESYLLNKTLRSTKRLPLCYLHILRMPLYHVSLSGEFESIVPTMVTHVSRSTPARTRSCSLNWYWSHHIPF